MAKKDKHVTIRSFFCYLQRSVAEPSLLAGISYPRSLLAGISYLRSLLAGISYPRSQFRLEVGLSALDEKQQYKF